MEQQKLQLTKLRLVFLTRKPLLLLLLYTYYVVHGPGETWTPLRGRCIYHSKHRAQ
jgi:hypothetical protein